MDTNEEIKELPSEKILNLRVEGHENENVIDESYVLQALNLT